MEEYIEKKINDELIKKDFKLWNKESIDFLLFIFEYKKYNVFHNVNLILLNDYIKWYSENMIEDPNIYSLENLKHIYSLIKEDISNNIYYNYVKILNKLNNVSTNDNINNEYTLENILKYILNLVKDPNYYVLIFGIIVTILFKIFNYINIEKPYEKKNIFEFKIPIPDNLINNSLIKLFLGEKFTI
jgi:hypothetical protein